VLADDFAALTKRAVLLQQRHETGKRIGVPMLNHTRYRFTRRAVPLHQHQQRQRELALRQVCPERFSG
jgi:hypothetical protein